MVYTIAATSAFSSVNYNVVLARTVTVTIMGDNKASIPCPIFCVPFRIMPWQEVLRQLHLQPLDLILGLSNLA